MTVKELKEELKKYPELATVIVMRDWDTGDEIELDNTYLYYNKLEGHLVIG